MSQDNPTVSVTIVLYNSGQTILDCLELLKEGIIENYLDVILIDNCSPDESYKIVKEFSHTFKVNIIRAEKNLGFAGGVNLSFKYVKGKYWLLLNPDALLSTTDIKKLVEIMEGNKELGVISPQIVNPQLEDSHLSLCFPSVSKAFMEVTRLSHLLPVEKRARLYKIPSSMEDELCRVDWVPGTALMVRKEIADKVGILSEEFFMYAEDVEFCWRIRNSGWDIAVYKGAKVSHIGGVSSKAEKNTETIRKSIPNYFKVDSHIIGTNKAFIVNILRALSYGLESIHPLRSKQHRSSSLKIFKENIRFIYLKILENFSMNTSQ